MLPLAQPIYTYVIPEGFEVAEGMVVEVPFGRTDKICMGVVWRVHGETPVWEKIKPIHAVLFDMEVVDRHQRDLWAWMADYYMCTLGEVMAAALPPRLEYLDLPNRVFEEGEEFQLPALSAAQQRVFEQIRDEKRGVTLLRGVTGSGKTEVYMHLAAEVLARGGQVLVLVPEIALTTQLIQRFKRVFGDRVTAYHSKVTAPRRNKIYQTLATSAGGELIIGARSAIFLPFRRLGLIVVDEEHDASYKQATPAPRYEARDCAVMMGRMTGCGVVLGSATPSLESYANALSGKYGYATLDERYGGAVPPEVIVSDTLRAAKRGERKSHFNKELLDRMTDTLARGAQVMLFQNRRGVAPYMECKGCGWVPHCKHCNVALTLHREKLVCHYCGKSVPLPTECPECGSRELTPMGFGTEKIEEETAKLFPQARIVRLDRDSVTSESAFNRIVKAIEQREYDIIIGTQMITKGFDFEGVELVGVLNADNLFANPDFRAGERAYQMLMQVAGRSGRREKPGTVVIQTSDVENPVIEAVVSGDYEAIAQKLLSQRDAYFYPPYARIFEVELRRRGDTAQLRRAANLLAVELRKQFGRRVLGPAAPPIDRVRGEWRMVLVVKVESGASVAEARGTLGNALNIVTQHADFKGVRIFCHVDPQ